MGKNKTHFSRDEQITLMSLWSIARSPLMIGADLTKLDNFTLSLLTNDEVIAVNQKSSNNRELFCHDGFYGWVADVPGSADKYLALFNTLSPNAANVVAAVPVKLSELGFSGKIHSRNLWQQKGGTLLRADSAGKVRIRDLWRQKDLGSVANEFAPVINAHGAGLYRLAPGHD
jgi:hypothetical protein